VPFAAISNAASWRTALPVPIVTSAVTTSECRVFIAESGQESERELNRVEGLNG
jgi:hypothetical protein